MSDRIDQFRTEHSEEGIGPLIWEALRAAIFLVARSRPPAEMLHELANEFALYMSTGRLSQAMAHATSEAHFAALLRARARQFIDGKLRTDESERLIDRAEKILEKDTRFESHGPPRLRRWTIKGGSSEPLSGGPAEVQALARATPLPASARRMSRTTQIASRVCSNPDLGDFLYVALRGASGTLLLADIRQLLDDRFSLRRPETISVSRRIGESSPLELILSGPPVEASDVEAQSVAVDALKMLSVRDIAILTVRLECANSAAAAGRLGMPSTAIDDTVGRCCRIILDLSGDDFAVTLRVLEILAGPR